ncbi:unnamed protein product [Ilex paraguariensis]|uniref:Meiosis-specific protein ASY3-like coiled-coil domain-containing protein n=1 Tax=Ilex paraguariensis TaxID=185542 RepID=A0ABC8RJZ2_9AQUA
MEINRQQNLRDDPMSECRSFGSNYHPCSQSRKISIGVVVDSLPKTRPKTVGENEATVVKMDSRRGIALEDRLKGEGVTAATTGKQAEAPERETSPWVSTRSYNKKIPASGDNTVQFFTNQISVLHPSDGKQKKFNKVNYMRKGQKDGTAERVEEFPLANAQEVSVTEKELVEDITNKTENRGSETLRMKLWEILGTVSSPNKHFSNSQAFGKGSTNLKPEQRIDFENPVGMPKYNSDTIESDSENPNHTVRRPVTRSLTRKRAPNKVQPKRPKSVPISSYTQKPLENIFSFKEGWSGRPCHTVNGGSSMAERKKSEQKILKTKPWRMCFPEQEIADEDQQPSGKSKTTSPAEKLPLFGNRTGSLCSVLPEKTSEFVEPKNGIQRNDSHESPDMTTADQPGDISGPTFQVFVDQQEDFANPSFTNIVDPKYNLESPTFEMRTPIKSSSPDPFSKVNHGELDDHILAERIFNVEGIRSFRSLHGSKPESHKIDAQMETSEDAGQLEDSPIMKSVPIMEGKYSENRLSKSSSEESDSESFQDFSSIEGLPRETEFLFPEISMVEKSKFVLHSTKRLRSQEGAKVTGISPTSDSPKGTGPSKQDQEDNLASAVALFALGLERVKSKMKSVTSQKSAEILMSVAEGIHLQLQNTESQIQTNLGILTSLSKSKQKRLETRFQEQQKQLKAMHERFKEEVNQHLQDCMSTLEGLEAQHIDCKGTVKKQKASHRKLIVQVEEAIETQLNDAERRIAAVHKLARENMLQLKCVIAECLKDDILS